MLFAVGAVSGTVLSFELGLLWPRFMGFAGPIIGMPFSLEGFAFFTEAIFLGVYLYGWERISPRAHLAAGVIVAVERRGVGDVRRDGQRVDEHADGRDASSAASVVEHRSDRRHVQSVDGAAGDAHAARRVRRDGARGRGVARGVLLRKAATATFHRRALMLALVVGAPAAILQPLSGDLSARVVARWQPIKLAALEGQFETEARRAAAHRRLPDVDAMTTRFAIEIPRGLSLLAFHDPNAEVMGLDDVRARALAAVVPVHVGFQMMVGLGTRDGAGRRSGRLVV